MFVSISDIVPDLCVQTRMAAAVFIMNRIGTIAGAMIIIRLCRPRTRAAPVAVEICARLRSVVLGRIQTAKEASVGATEPALTHLTFRAVLSRLRPRSIQMRQYVLIVMVIGIRNRFTGGQTASGLSKRRA